MIGVKLWRSNKGETEVSKDKEECEDIERRHWESAD